MNRICVKLNTYDKIWFVMGFAENELGIQSFFARVLYFDDIFIGLFILALKATTNYQILNMKSVSMQI